MEENDADGGGGGHHIIFGGEMSRPIALKFLLVTCVDDGAPPNAFVFVENEASVFAAANHLHTHSIHHHAVDSI